MDKNDEYIINPATKRRVKKTGHVGQQLLKQQSGLGLHPHPQQPQSDQPKPTKFKPKLTTVHESVHEVPNESKPIAPLLPMLAQKYGEREKHIKYPCAVSRKLDGIRMLSRVRGDNVVLTSRTGKEFMHVDKIRKHILDMYTAFGFGNEMVLDGEVYSHDLPFSVISGAIRSTRQKSANDHLLEYWIFDIVDTTMSYEQRAKLLGDIRDWYVKNYALSDRILRFELYELSDKESVTTFHANYVKEGFEGLIIRNLNGKYVAKRSNDLQKYKSFEDAEFLIVGFKVGTGSEEGAIIFECKCGDKTFDVRPRGSIEGRVEQAKHGQSYIGKDLTVRYQPSIKQSDIDRHELPRFPIGIEVRDYE